MDVSKPLRILFLCTGNSCRSQMAEAWARHLKPGVIEPYSAGIDPKGIDSLAVAAMAEVGIDLSGRHSKHVNELKNIVFDYVITVCGHADEHCPAFPGATRKVHVGFDDPPQLAKNAATREEKLGHYRRIRDEIKTFIQGLPQTLDAIVKGDK